VFDTFFVIEVLNVCESVNFYEEEGRKEKKVGGKRWLMYLGQDSYSDHVEELCH